MKTQQRFHETMAYGHPDRVPYFEEGIRQDVLKEWYKQGLDRKTDLSELFLIDQFEEIEPDLEPIPEPRVWPEHIDELGDFQKRLKPHDRKRLPRKLKKQRHHWADSDQLLFLRVHRGFFLSLGTHGWRRFEKIMSLVAEDPSFINKFMAMQGEFAAALMQGLLEDITIDAVVFSEPIGGNEGPLISPKMYEAYVLTNYQPLLNVLKENKVKTIIFRTYANAAIYIPSILKYGINCLWACETNVQAMDYLRLRREYGPELRLIGGIDLDVLREGKEAIRREIIEKVPPLIAQGGYIPLADGRVRADMPFENYRYYRQLLEEVTTS